MVEGLLPYPAYKPSGVEWLGDVPTHWGTRRLKGLAANIAEQTLDRPTDRRYVALEHVESWTGHVEPTDGADAGDGQLKVFERGDVLFGKLRPYLAKVVHAEFRGLCVGEFFVLRAERSISPRYLTYVMRSKPAIGWINGSTFGARMPRADWTFVGDMPLPVPDPREQAAIARFLDHATSRIDRAIRAKEKLLALLEEQKLAFVRQAVTGQIDVRTGQRYSAYKPAVVDGLTQVPKHWQQWRLKGLLRSVDQRSATGSETILSLRRDHGVVVYADHFARPPQGATLVGFKQVSPGQLVVNRMQANNGLVFHSALDGLVSPDYSVFESARPLNMQYLSDLLRLQEYRAHFRREAKGLGTGTAGFLRLYDDALLRTLVHLPPIEEQQSIVDWLQGTVHKIDQVSAKVQRERSLMEQFKCRLVADAVTGKLDVRDVAVRLPNEPDDPSTLDCDHSPAEAKTVRRSPGGSRTDHGEKAVP